jgi:hypothetical protein
MQLTDYTTEQLLTLRSEQINRFLHKDNPGNIHMVREIDRELLTARNIEHAPFFVLEITDRMTELRREWDRINYEVVQGFLMGLRRAKHVITEADPACRDRSVTKSCEAIGAQEDEIEMYLYVRRELS